MGGRGTRFAGLAERLDVDAEFAVTARLCSATIGLVGGEERCVLRVDGGRVTALPESTTDLDIEIAATPEVWAELAAPLPRPFFHDLMPAVLHHGVTVTGDPMTWWPSYPVLQRMLEVLRAG